MRAAPLAEFAALASCKSSPTVSALPFDWHSVHPQTVFGHDLTVDLTAVSALPFAWHWPHLQTFFVPSQMDLPWSLQDSSVAMAMAMAMAMWSSVEIWMATWLATATASGVRRLWRWRASVTADS